MGLLKLSKYIIKKILLKLGYKIINKYNHYFGIDESIEKIFNKAKLDKNNLTIFDIGANIGQSIKRFRRKFNKSKIYSFEPNPEIFKNLVEIQKKDSNLIEKILSKFGLITWDIPNIVKFPRSDIDRIYFADILFVNTKLIDCN
jgi:hypothetical protein